MICKQCQADGIWTQTSRVYLNGTMTVLVVPVNKEGHHHSGNQITRSYTCGRGHSWEETEVKNPCPICALAWRE